MIDKQKIILMSKLAVYDKNHGEKDRRINGYFLNDYIYIKNFWNRFFALIGSLIVISYFFLNKIVIEGIKLYFVNFKSEISRMVLFVAIVMIIYTVIGTKKAVTEYKGTQRRLRDYFITMQQLDRLKDEVEMETGEASKHGADIVYTRNLH